MKSLRGKELVETVNQDGFHKQEEFTPLKIIQQTMKRFSEIMTSSQTWTWKP